MGDQLRIKLVSGVILVVVFAAGGLVGAAVSQPGVADRVEEREGNPLAAADGSNEGQEDERSDEESRSRRNWFEIAGATPEQEEYIRGTILKEHRDRMEALDQDSTVLAFQSRLDTIRSDWRSAHRGLEAYYDPKEDSLFDLTRSQIRATLHPEAQIVYDSIWAAERARDERRRD